jgi:hypothetical protein
MYPRIYPTPDYVLTFQVSCPHFNFVATYRTLKSDNVKLLEWWREHKYSFPILSYFARDILFETVEAITCLKDWKRAGDRKQYQLEDPEVEQAFTDFSHDYCYFFYLVHCVIMDCYYNMDCER